MISPAILWPTKITFSSFKSLHELPHNSVYDEAAGFIINIKDAAS